MDEGVLSRVDPGLGRELDAAAGELEVRRLRQDCVEHALDVGYMIASTSVFVRPSQSSAVTVESDGRPLLGNVQVVGKSTLTRPPASTAVCALLRFRLAPSSPLRSRYEPSEQANGGVFEA